MRRARVAIAVVALALFWLLATGWLAAPLLGLVQRGMPRAGESVADATFGARTAIVLLGSGTRYDDRGQLVPKRDALARITTSAQLYAQCKQVAQVCKVFVSGGNPQHHEQAEADNYLPWLLRQQVPRADIIIENRSLTTYENARNISSILPRGYYDLLIVVTSAYHMPRALLDFHRFDLAPLPVVSNTLVANCGWLPRFRNLENAETALHEIIGIAQFHVYRAIGWF